MLERLRRISKRKLIAYSAVLLFLVCAFGSVTAAKLGYFPQFAKTLHISADTVAPASAICISWSVSGANPEHGQFNDTFQVYTNPATGNRDLVSGQPQYIVPRDYGPVIYYTGSYWVMAGYAPSYDTYYRSYDGSELPGTWFSYNPTNPSIPNPADLSTPILTCAAYDGGGGGGGSGTGSIQGYVTNNGVNMNGVTITVTGNLITTPLTTTTTFMSSVSRTVNYSITNLPAGGPYTVTATSTGYIASPTSRSVTVASGATGYADFAMTQNTGGDTQMGTLVGDVIAGYSGPGTGTHMAGVTVTAKGPGGTFTTTSTSDTTHNVTFNNNQPITAGVYTLTATYSADSSYIASPASSSVTVPNGGIVSALTFVMAKTGGGGGTSKFDLIGDLSDPSGESAKGVKVTVSADASADCYAINSTQVITSHAFYQLNSQASLSEDYAFIGLLNPLKTASSVCSIRLQFVSDKYFYDANGNGLDDDNAAPLAIDIRSGDIQVSGSKTYVRESFGLSKKTFDVVPSGTNFNVIGRVVDESGKPVAGATVSLDCEYPNPGGIYPKAGYSPCSSTLPAYGYISTSSASYLLPPGGTEQHNYLIQNVPFRTGFSFSAKLESSEYYFDANQNGINNGGDEFIQGIDPSVIATNLKYNLLDSKYYYYLNFKVKKKIPQICTPDASLFLQYLQNKLPPLLVTSAAEIIGFINQPIKISIFRDHPELLPQFRAALNDIDPKYSAKFDKLTSQPWFKKILASATQTGSFRLSDVISDFLPSSPSDAIAQTQNNLQHLNVTLTTGEALRLDAARIKYFGRPIPEDVNNSIYGPAVGRAVQKALQPIMILGLAKVVPFALDHPGFTAQALSYYFNNGFPILSQKYADGSQRVSVVLQPTYLGHSIGANFHGEINLQRTQQISNIAGSGACGVVGGENALNGTLNNLYDTILTPKPDSKLNIDLHLNNGGNNSAAISFGTNF